MKKLLFSCLLAAGFGFTALAQFPSVDKSPADIAYFPEKASKRLFSETVEEQKSLKPKIKIVYSRPYKSGREIFGELIKFGEVWRVGANEEAEITFYQNVKIGETNVKAGTYTLFVIPNEKSWTVIINKDVNIWGAYKFNEANDVARVNVPVSESDDVIENFSIAMVDKGENTAHINFGWDKTFVALPVVFK